jgi:basic membrane lipoprotein Med (substrate-binding protein (PBP1-ABC) superfamily)
MKFVDRAVEMTVSDAIAGRWRGGQRSLGLADGAVGLSLRGAPGLTSEIRGRLQTISDFLATGSLSTGV